MIEKKYMPISNFIPSNSEPGLKLHIAEFGEGAPVLFVHGATVASHGFYAPVKGRNWMVATAEAGFASYACLMTFGAFVRNKSRRSTF